MCNHGSGRCKKKRFPGFISRFGRNRETPRDSGDRESRFDQSGSRDSSSGNRASRFERDAGFGKSGIPVWRGSGESTPMPGHLGFRGLALELVARMRSSQVHSGTISARPDTLARRSAARPLSGTPAGTFRPTGARRAGPGAGRLRAPPPSKAAAHSRCPSSSQEAPLGGTVAGGGLLASGARENKAGRGEDRRVKETAIRPFKLAPSEHEQRILPVDPARFSTVPNPLGLQGAASLNAPARTIGGVRFPRARRWSRSSSTHATCFEGLAWVWASY